MSEFGCSSALVAVMSSVAHSTHDVKFEMLTHDGVKWQLTLIFSRTIKCPIFGGEIKTVRAENYEGVMEEVDDHIWVHMKQENGAGLAKIKFF